MKTKTILSSVLIVLSLFITIYIVVKSEPTPTSNETCDPIYLGNAWKIDNSPDTSEGASISQKGYNTTGWEDATVPGTVLKSYVNNGTYSDPYFGKDNLAYIVDNYERTHYWYRLEFEVPGSYSGRRAWLNFDAVARNSFIYINGSKIGQIDGSFIRGQFDVTNYVNVGQTNTLAVLVFADNDSLNSRGPHFTYHSLNENECHMLIPDKNIGIYRDVYLKSTGPVKIVDPFIISDLPLPDTTSADLKIKIELKNLTASSQSGTLKGTINPGNITFEKYVSLSGNETKQITLDKSTHSQLSISSPMLWWPTGYGEQPLYTLCFEFEMSETTLLSDKWSDKFGIREVGYDTTQGPLIIKINGEKIFCRGGNYITEDVMTYYTDEQADADGMYQKDINFNFLRLWKGMTTYPGVYESADKYGILVMDEFFNLGNHQRDNNYGESPTDQYCDANVRDKLKRIRNHPCIVLYCGENEHWTPTNIEDMYESAISDLHPEIRYISNSAKDPVSGYGPWQIKDPKWYWDSYWGFHTEVGLACVPTVESMRLMMDESDLWPPTADAGTSWFAHDLGDANTGGWDYISGINDRYGVSSNIDEFCMKAQVLNYNNNRAMMESSGDGMWSDGEHGLLYWMTKSAYPSLMWQSWDYYYGLTGAYFGNKKALEPVHIQWDCRNGNVSVINTTLQARNNLTVEAWIYNSDGTQKYSNSQNINADANSKTECFTIDNPSGLSTIYFIRLRLKSGTDVLSNNFYWDGVTYLNYVALANLPSVNLDVSEDIYTSGDKTIDDATITNNTSNIAFFIRLKMIKNSSNKRVLPIIYEDNYFSLVPGESRKIKIEFKTSDLDGEDPELILELYTDKITPTPPGRREAKTLKGKTVVKEPIQDKIDEYQKQIDRSQEFIDSHPRYSKRRY